MAGERVRLEVKERETRGSRESRRLRRDGFIPGVLYGGEGKARAFYVEERVLRGALGGDHGVHAILDVVLEGQQKAHHAVLKDYQLDPRRSSLLHVDLHEVRLDRPIQAQVAVELTGEPAGANFGGVLTQIVREVTVEALPMSIPDRLELDVTELEIGGQVRVGEIVVPEDVKLLDDPEAVVATVAAPRVEVEEEVVEEIEGEEVEAAAEAEAEPEAGAEAQAEGDTGES
jgi:large subunit ribosomal protein L25